MSEFLRRLKPSKSVTPGRRWVYLPYDQLHRDLGLLADIPDDQLGVVLIESTWKTDRRPYHKQKLALLLSSQRHFALELQALGVAVRYQIGARSPAEILLQEAEALGPIDVMDPAERELRKHLEPLTERGLLRVHPHGGWLTDASDFQAATEGRAAWRMDAFYRQVRRRYRWLMEASGKPVGGRWSLDSENRQPWRGVPAAPEPPRFSPDPITLEVIELIERKFGGHPGQVDPGQIAASDSEVEQLWAWVLEHCMESFGPFEDAMSTDSLQLFHTRVSGLLNIHRLMPKRVLEDVLALDIPLNSKEGFVRQVGGWREFVRHVHRETDGFRVYPGSSGSGEDVDVAPSFLEATSPLPSAFWGTTSGLNCLDHAVGEVLETGYSHHINRLMVLANWATLLGVEPRQITDWFWVTFEDAYDWVVEPNVLGMGTYAVGPLMVTKPYVSGSAYIHKMSNYCDACSFHPKKTCPMTPLYWDFLRRNSERLASNPRLRIVMSAQRKRSQERLDHDREVAKRVFSALASEVPLSPDSFSDLERP